MKVVLVGAGHSHLYLAKRARVFTARGIELVLVEPGAFDYSGLATGVLGGEYEWTLDRVNAKRLIETSGGKFMRDRVIGLDAGKRLVLLESGGALGYDAVSFNIGSEVNTGLIPGAQSAWTVKPIANLWRLREHLQNRFKGGQTLRAVVIGGGATGVEVAANIDALARRHRVEMSVTLASAAPRLLSHYSQHVSRRVTRCLKCRGISVACNEEIERVSGNAAHTKEGRRYEFDVLVLATGLEAHPLTRKLGLACDKEEGLRVNSCLRSISADNVFGVGDCIAFNGRKLPMLGVHGVRQAPVLMHNLLASVSEGHLRQYRPRKNYLSILNLGCGDALALWGPFSWLGKASFWWKDRIDRKFLAEYRVED
jgi:NADH dehydrogenase FAD-containing subunit